VLRDFEVVSLKPWSFSAPLRRTFANGFESRMIGPLQGSKLTINLLRKCSAPCSEQLSTELLRKLSLIRAGLEDALGELHFAGHFSSHTGFAPRLSTSMVSCVNCSSSQNQRARKVQLSWTKRQNSNVLTDPKHRVLSSGQSRASYRSSDTEPRIGQHRYDTRWTAFLN